MSKFTSNKTTAGVLDSADEFIRKMDWLMFVDEYNLDPEPVEGSDWVPGNPLYGKIDNSLAVMDREWWLPSGSTYVRPMFESMSWYSFHNQHEVPFVKRCKNCEVDWKGDDPCWICGEERTAPLSFSHPSSQEVLGQIREVRRDRNGVTFEFAFDGDSMNDSFHDMIAAMMGIRPAAQRGVSAIQEWIDAAISEFQFENNQTVFQIAESETVECDERFSGIAEPVWIWVDELTHLDSEIVLPDDLDLSGRPVVRPPVVNRRGSLRVPPGSYHDTAGYVADVPITQQRRRRNV